MKIPREHLTASGRVISDYDWEIRMYYRCQLVKIFASYGAERGEFSRSLLFRAQEHLRCACVDLQLQEIRFEVQSGPLIACFVYDPEEWSYREE